MILRGLMILLICFAFTQFQSDDIESQLDSFAPENDLQISVYDKARNEDITEEVFNDIMTSAKEVYTSLVADQSAVLDLAGEWANSTVNAYAKRVGNNWWVRIYGGLARHPHMTIDGLTIVICHELGHHMGGAPKKTSWYGTPIWAAAEGQSDYYAAAKCARKMFGADENNIEIAAELELPEEVIQSCHDLWGESEQNVAICLRTAKAGESLGFVLADITKKEMPSLTLPSDLVVKKTNLSGYPGVQCRVDTMLQGALCLVDHEVMPGDHPFDGFCNRKDGYEIGPRPLCWYNPEDFE